LHALRAGARASSPTHGRRPRSQRIAYTQNDKRREHKRRIANADAIGSVIARAHDAACARSCRRGENRTAAMPTREA